MDVAERSERVRRWLASITAPPATGEEGLEALPVGGLESARDQLVELAADGTEQGEAATGALDPLLAGEVATEDGLDGLEAIVLPKLRPVVDVVNGDYHAPPSPWGHLAKPAAKEVIRPALKSIGRIELPDHPKLPYAGTGFVVGEGLMMTNRHVALLFAQGHGLRELRFQPGLTAAVDFVREVVPSDPILLEVRGVRMIHPYWDMALLEVAGAHPAPLELDPIDPAALTGADVVVVGYPAQDSRNDLALQHRIFHGIFEVKRLQPGHATGRRSVASYGRTVRALSHDASTLGGNSGSAVLSVATGRVVGLHFAGVYLESNYAVPAFELARDGRVVDAGVRFAGAAAGGTPDWATAWADGGTEAPAAAAVRSPAPRGVSATAGVATVERAEGGDLRVTVPVEITITEPRS